MFCCRHSVTLRSLIDDLAFGGVAENVEDVEQFARVPAAETATGPPSRATPHRLFSRRIAVGRERPVRMQLAQVRVFGHRLEYIDLTAREQRARSPRTRDSRCVAPISVTMPCSTAPSSESCCDLLKRWISSMNRNGAGALKNRLFLACSITSRTSLTPALIGREREHFPVEGRGHEPCQRRLADARRTPQNERGHVARIEKPSENAAGSDQMFLPDIVVQRAGPEPFRQRNVGLHAEKNYLYKGKRFTRIIHCGNGFEKDRHTLRYARRLRRYAAYVFRRCR